MRLLTFCAHQPHLLHAAEAHHQPVIRDRRTSIDGYRDRRRFDGDKPVAVILPQYGTGRRHRIFAKHGGQLFLITNWHVVSGRNYQTRKHLSKELALPDRLKYTVGCRGHVGEWMDIDCMLYEDSESSEQPEKPVWLEHASHGHEVDVVAIPIILPDNAEVFTRDRVNTVSWTPKMRQLAKVEPCP
jgi:hypothetical protein